MDVYTTITEVTGVEPRLDVLRLRPQVQDRRSALPARTEEEIALTQSRNVATHTISHRVRGSRIDDKGRKGTREEVEKDKKKIGKDGGNGGTVVHTLRAIGGIAVLLVAYVRICSHTRRENMFLLQESIDEGERHFFGD